MEETPKINGLSHLIFLMFLQASASFSDSSVALLGPSTALNTVSRSWRPGFVSMTLLQYEVSLSEVILYKN